jgi:hypothetical protein
MPVVGFLDPTSSEVVAMNPSVQDELNQAPSHVPNKSGAEMVGILL